MKAWSRRKFVGAGAAAVAAGAAGWKAAAGSGGPVRLVPLAGVEYSASFLRFASRARFPGVRAALAAVRDRSLPVGVAHADHIPASPDTPRGADTTLSLATGALSAPPAPAAV